jgi:hypothetical protein
MDTVITPNRCKWLEKNRGSRESLFWSAYFLGFIWLTGMFSFSDIHAPWRNDEIGRILVFDRDVLPKSIESWGLLEKGFNYDVVAVFGSQSTGKSKFKTPNIFIFLVFLSPHIHFVILVEHSKWIGLKQTIQNDSILCCHIHTDSKWHRWIT